jgi:hypothetical protein
MTRITRAIAPMTMLTIGFKVVVVRVERIDVR